MPRHHDHERRIADLDYGGEDRRHPSDPTPSGIWRAVANGTGKKAATVGVPVTLLFAILGWLGKNMVEAQEKRMEKIEDVQAQQMRRLERINGKLDKILLYIELSYGKLPSMPAPSSSDDEPEGPPR